MKVIAISGKARHGKDTTANILRHELESRGNRVLIAHYADLLKYICAKFFGWNGEKDDAGRQLLQYVGTDVIRVKMPDFWVDFIISIMNLFPDTWEYVLIPDCRFPNEIDRLKEAGFDSIHIRVRRPGFESPLSKEQQLHASETALDNVTPSCYIDNNGSIKDLEDLLAFFVDTILEGET